MKTEMSHRDELIRRYDQNTISEEERLELLQLIRSGQVDEVLKDKIGETFREEMLKDQMPDAKEKATSEQMFESILAYDRPASIRKFPAVAQYAASLLILGLIGLIIYFQNSKEVLKSEPLALTKDEFVSVKNNGADTKKLELLDGSFVWLQPGGEVRYANEFRDRREVFLSGEAFFEVTKDAAHPFLVYANEVTTRVLGTSFRIIANKAGKEVVVAVKTGKVSVFTKYSYDKSQTSGSEEITLTPNQQAIYKRSEHIVVKKIVEEPEVIVEHKSLKNSYINEQVLVILKALSESYGVEMRYDSAALSDCTLTSDAIESEGLFDQLDIICSALGGTYKLENDASIVINTNGCRQLTDKP